MAVIVDPHKVNLDSDTEEGRFNNLMMNMMGGLDYQDLTEDDKALCAKFGYHGPNKNKENA